MIILLKSYITQNYYKSIKLLFNGKSGIIANIIKMYCIKQYRLRTVQIFKLQRAINHYTDFQRLVKTIVNGISRQKTTNNRASRQRVINYRGSSCRETGFSFGNRYMTIKLET